MGGCFSSVCDLIISYTPKHAQFHGAAPVQPRWRSARENTVLYRQYICKYESVAFHSFSDLDPDGGAEYWSVVHQGVEFSVFAARIDTRRETVQKLLIILPPGAGDVEFREIDAGDL